MTNPLRQQTASDAVLQGLADDHRRILSRWRAVVLVRRATLAIPRSGRRWDNLPDDPRDLASLLRTMHGRGDIAALHGLPGLFEVTAPFARTGPLREEEILLEASPFAVISHYSALSFHGLTEQQPNLLTATAPRSAPPDTFPVDTEPSDWDDIALPGFRRRPDAILRTPVRWATESTDRYNGFATYQPFGARIRVTTPERTLVDALQAPALSGGITNVLRAWGLGLPTSNLDRLVKEVERYDVAVLRQRAGLLIERLHQTHPALDGWAASSTRGSSSRLVGNEPFASTFDERWNLSLNGPMDVLEDYA